MMRSNLEKCQYWQNVIEDWKQSELTQKKYCEVKGVNYSSFKNWFYRLQRLAKSGVLIDQPDFVPIKLKSPASLKHPVDMPIETSVHSKEHFKMLLASGIQIVVPHDFDESILLRLVAVLN